jgi:hypothetical protein
MDKQDDGSVSMTIRFPADVYYYLSEVAKRHRRAKNQEVLALIEEAAQKMNIALDIENPNIIKMIMNHGETIPPAGPKLEKTSSSGIIPEPDTRSPAERPHTGSVPIVRRRPEMIIEPSAVPEEQGNEKNVN